MTDRQSIPRIVNVRATDKGLQSPEFLTWLFERLAKPLPPRTRETRDWITSRFEKVS